MLIRCALLTLALVVACAHPPVRATAPAAALSTAMPPLVTLAGRPTRLDEVVHGRVALVSLWATWCPSCEEELGALARLERQLRPRGGTVVGVAVGEEAGAVGRYLADHEAPPLQLVDRAFRLADALGQTRVPSTLVFDRRGRIVFRGAALDAPALRAVRAALGTHRRPTPVALLSGP